MFSKQGIAGIFLLLLGGTQAKAQLFARGKARQSEPAPKAILVQLSTNENRVKALSRNAAENKALLRQLKADTDSTIAKMVSDFKDNFRYCPYYFYADTNAHLVRAGKFAGVLLNGELQPVNNITLSPEDSYNIVYFGYPIATATEKQTGKDNDYNSTGAVLTSSKKKLVVLTKDMKLVQSPLPDGAKSVNRRAGKKPAAEYKYESPRFDIYYRPTANIYSGKLREFYGPYPY